jgi:ribonuclease J
MQLIIHRGTQEIGGTCVEIATDQTRIMLDFGMPLVDARKEPFDSKTLVGKTADSLKKSKILPDIKGLYNTEEKSIDAILISHSHMDHYGLLSYVHKGIPVYMSQGAQELVEVSSIFTPNKIGKINSRIINTKKAFNIGDIKITPY